MCDWRATGTYSRDIGNWGYLSVLLEKHVFLHQFTASPQQTYQMETVQDNGKQSTTIPIFSPLSGCSQMHLLLAVALPSSQPTSNSDSTQSLRDRG